MTNTKAEFIATLSKNAADAEAIAGRSIAARTYCLVNKDYTLAIGLIAGETFRFVSPVDGAAKSFDSCRKAANVMDHWNSRLTGEQRKAGCMVRIVTFREALQEYAVIQRDLIKILSN